MPGSSPYQAFEAFVAPLERAMSCIARTKTTCSEGGKTVVDTDHGLFLTGGPRDYIRLKGGTFIELRARMRYKIILDDREGMGPYRVTTRAYDYSLHGLDSSQVLDYHWHPGGNSHEIEPHLHLGDAQLADNALLDSKQHLPTGRITLEDVVRAAIRLGAAPLVNDWDKRLMESEGPHKLYRTWS